MTEKLITKERNISKSDYFNGDPENRENRRKMFSFGETFRTDGGSILLLLLLYVLQGIPLGLAGSIPMLLQHRGVSYKEQALFR